MNMKNSGIELEIYLQMSVALNEITGILKKTFSNASFSQTYNGSWFFLKGSDKQPPVIRGMACQWTSNKLLSEPMMTQCIYTSAWALGGPEIGAPSPWKSNVTVAKPYPFGPQNWRICNVFLWRGLPNLLEVLGNSHGGSPRASTKSGH